MARRPLVLIVSEVRSGGTVLFDALGRHTRLRMAGEIFDFSPQASWRPKREELARSAGAATPIDKYSDVIPLFNCLFANYNGFSLHREGQLAPSNPAWQFLANVNGLHVIHLYRRNTLEQYVSHQLAIRSGVWHQHTAADARRPEWSPFHIDVDKCLTTMRRWRSHFDWSLEQLQNQPHIVLTYEELCDDLEGVLAACQAFLGVPVEALKLGYQKLPPKDLRRLIANFQDLSAAISETEFAECIDGDILSSAH